METFATLVLWLTGLFVLLALVLGAVGLVRVSRATKRVKKRLTAVTTRRPGIDLERLHFDLQRVSADAERATPLFARLQAAIAIVRAGPRLAPPEMPAVFLRLQQEIAALRALAR